MPRGKGEQQPEPVQLLSRLNQARPCPTKSPAKTRGAPVQAQIQFISVFTVLTRCPTCNIQKARVETTYCQDQKPNNITGVRETQILKLLAKELR